MGIFLVILSCVRSHESFRRHGKKNCLSLAHDRVHVAVVAADVNDAGGGPGRGDDLVAQFSLGQQLARLGIEGVELAVPTAEGFCLEAVTKLLRQSYYPLLRRTWTSIVHLGS